MRPKLYSQEQDWNKAYILFNIIVFFLQLYVNNFHCRHTYIYTLWFCHILLPSFPRLWKVSMAFEGKFGRKGYILLLFLLSEYARKKKKYLSQFKDTQRLTNLVENKCQVCTEQPAAQAYLHSGRNLSRTSKCLKHQHQAEWCRWHSRGNGCHAEWPELTWEVGPCQPHEVPRGTTAQSCTWVRTIPRTDTG